MGKDFILKILIKPIQYMKVNGCQVLRMEWVRNKWLMVPFLLDNLRTIRDMVMGNSLI